MDTNRYVYGKYGEEVENIYAGILIQGRVPQFDCRRCCYHALNVKSEWNGYKKYTNASDILVQIGRTHLRNYSSRFGLATNK